MDSSSPWEVVLSLLRKLAKPKSPSKPHQESSTIPAARVPALTSMMSLTWTWKPNESSPSLGCFGWRFYSVYPVKDSQLPCPLFYVQSGYFSLCSGYLPDYTDPFSGPSQVRIRPESGRASWWGKAEQSYLLQTFLQENVYPCILSNPKRM